MLVTASLAYEYTFTCYNFLLFGDAPGCSEPARYTRIQFQAAGFLRTSPTFDESVSMCVLSGSALEIDSHGGWTSIHDKRAHLQTWERHVKVNGFEA